MNNTATPFTLSPELERHAQRRVKARLGWYTPAAIHVCVISGQAVAGWWQGRLWPIAPALGWGVGLLAHGLTVFARGVGAPLRERMLHRERERLQSSTHHQPL